MPKSSPPNPKPSKPNRASKSPWSIASLPIKPAQPRPSSKETTPNSSRKAIPLLFEMESNVSLKIKFLLKLTFSEE